MDVEVQTVRVGAAADPDVRTGGKGGEIRLRVVLPLADGLRHEGQRWDHEEDAFSGAAGLFGDAKAGKGLAGAARHDQLAAISLFKPFGHGLQRFALVVLQLFLWCKADVASAKKLG